MSELLKVTKIINAPASVVWDGLTKPELVKQYFFGTNVESDWKMGSPIRFRGEWQGQPYEDKGTITSISPGKHVSYDYWSSMSGEPDIPQNYHEVSYDLQPRGEGTELTITQETTAEKKAHSEENWNKILEGLKEIIEQ